MDALFAGCRKSSVSISVCLLDRLTNKHYSNAMTFTFMSDGIPIVYYGQEQGFNGAKDPVRILRNTYSKCLTFSSGKP